jgi:hypothetical protein
MRLAGQLPFVALSDYSARYTRALDPLKLAFPHVFANSP